MLEKLPETPMKLRPEATPLPAVAATGAQPSCRPHGGAEVLLGPVVEPRQGHVPHRPRGCRGTASDRPSCAFCLGAPQVGSVETSVRLSLLLQPRSPHLPATQGPGAPVCLPVPSFLGPRWSLSWHPKISEPMCSRTGTGNPDLRDASPPHVPPKRSSVCGSGQVWKSGAGSAGRSWQEPLPG